MTPGSASWRLSRSRPALARVFLAAKGVDYCQANAFSWIKMALFETIAVVSVAPTFSFIVWRRQAREAPAFRPPAGEVARLRHTLYLEAALFALNPLCAAAMARGNGS